VNVIKTKVLFSEEEIKTRLQEVAKEITERLKDCDKVNIVIVLKSGLIVGADLVRLLPIFWRIDFFSMSAVPAESNNPGKERRVDRHTTESIVGSTVLLIDAVIDSGITLLEVIDHIKTRNPKEIVTFVLIDRPKYRDPGVQIDFCGFTVDSNSEEAVLVGYGMDENNQWRGLPHIEEWREEVVQCSKNQTQPEMPAETQLVDGKVLPLWTD
jgi:hypoxanthine phosphoribosyltransferase